LIPENTLRIAENAPNFECGLCNSSMMKEMFESNRSSGGGKKVVVYHLERFPLPATGREESWSECYTWSVFQSAEHHVSKRAEACGARAGSGNKLSNDGLERRSTELFGTSVMHTLESPNTVGNGLSFFQPQPFLQCPFQPCHCT
jgi:hypothetical protein